MTARDRLPDRRPAETLVLEFSSLRYTGRDAGILISLLLQHGCAAEVIAGAVSRDVDGTPSGVIGAVLDLIARRP